MIYSIGPFPHCPNSDCPLPHCPNADSPLPHCPKSPMTDLSVDASISASAFRLFPDLKRFSVSALSHDRPLRHWTRLVAFSENFNDSFLWNSLNRDYLFQLSSLSSFNLNHHPNFNCIRSTWAHFWEQRDPQINVFTCFSGCFRFTHRWIDRFLKLL